MQLVILYKSGYIDKFSEKDIDCGKLIIHEHAANLNDALRKERETATYLLDNYNSVNLDEIISVRVV